MNLSQMLVKPLDFFPPLFFQNFVIFGYFLSSLIDHELKLVPLLLVSFFLALIDFFLVSLTCNCVLHIILMFYLTNCIR